MNRGLVLFFRGGIARQSTGLAKWASLSLEILNFLEIQIVNILIITFKLKYKEIEYREIKLF